MQYLTRNIAAPARRNLCDWFLSDPFEDFFPARSAGRTAAAWMPAVDIKEDEEKFVLTVDVPGVDPSELEITVEGGQLSIQGERKTESEAAGTIPDLQLEMTNDALNV